MPPSYSLPLNPDLPAPRAASNAGSVRASWIRNDWRANPLAPLLPCRETSADRSSTRSPTGLVPSQDHADPATTRRRHLGVLPAMAKPDSRSARLEARKPGGVISTCPKHPRFGRRRQHPSDASDTARPGTPKRVNNPWRLPPQLRVIPRGYKRSSNSTPSQGDGPAERHRTLGACSTVLCVSVQNATRSRSRLTRRRRARVLRHAGRGDRGARSPVVPFRFGIPCPSVDASRHGRPRAFRRRCCGSAPAGRA